LGVDDELVRGELRCEMEGSFRSGGDDGAQINIVTRTVISVDRYADDE